MNGGGADVALCSLVCSDQVVTRWVNQVLATPSSNDGLAKRFAPAGFEHLTLFASAVPFGPLVPPHAEPRTTTPSTHAARA